MPDQPTAVAMRLTEIAFEYSEMRELSLEYRIVLATRALDDAGVAEAVKACEKMIEIAESRETLVVRLVAMEALAHRALAALTGTGEASDE